MFLLNLVNYKMHLLPGVLGASSRKIFSNEGMFEKYSPFLVVIAFILVFLPVAILIALGVSLYADVNELTGIAVFCVMLAINAIVYGLFLWRSNAWRMSIWNYAAFFAAFLLLVAFQVGFLWVDSQCISTVHCHSSPMKFLFFCAYGYTSQLWVVFLAEPFSYIAVSAVFIAVNMFFEAIVVFAAFYTDLKPLENYQGLDFEVKQRQEANEELLRSVTTKVQSLHCDHWATRVFLRVQGILALAVYALIVNGTICPDDDEDCQEKHVGWITFGAIILGDICVTLATWSGRLKSPTTTCVAQMFVRFSMFIFGARFWFIGHSAVFLTLSFFFGRSVINSVVPDAKDVNAKLAMKIVKRKHKGGLLGDAQAGFRQFFQTHADAVSLLLITVAYAVAMYVSYKEQTDLVLYGINMPSGEVYPQYYTGVGSLFVAYACIAGMFVHRIFSNNDFEIDLKVFGLAVFVYALIIAGGLVAFDIVRSFIVLYLCLVFPAIVYATEIAYVRWVKNDYLILPVAKLNTAKSVRIRKASQKRFDESDDEEEVKAEEAAPEEQADAAPKTRWGDYVVIPAIVVDVGLICLLGALISWKVEPEWIGYCISGALLTLLFTMVPIIEWFNNGFAFTSNLMVNSFLALGCFVGVLLMLWRIQLKGEEDESAGGLLMAFFAYPAIVASIVCVYKYADDGWVVNGPVKYGLGIASLLVFVIFLLVAVFFDPWIVGCFLLFTYICVGIVFGVRPVIASWGYKLVTKALDVVTFLCILCFAIAVGASDDYERSGFLSFTVAAGVIFVLFAVAVYKYYRNVANGLIIDYLGTVDILPVYHYVPKVGTRDPLVADNNRVWTTYGLMATAYCWGVIATFFLDDLWIGMVVCCFVMSSFIIYQLHCKTQPLILVADAVHFLDEGSDEYQDAIRQALKAAQNAQLTSTKHVLTDVEEGQHVAEQKEDDEHKHEEHDDNEVVDDLPLTTRACFGPLPKVSLTRLELAILGMPSEQSALPNPTSWHDKGQLLYKAIPRMKFSLCGQVVEALTFEYNGYQLTRHAAYQLLLKCDAMTGLMFQRKSKFQTQLELEIVMAAERIKREKATTLKSLLHEMAMKAKSEGRVSEYQGMDFEKLQALPEESKLRQDLEAMLQQYEASLAEREKKREQAAEQARRREEQRLREEAEYERERIRLEQLSAEEAAEDLRRRQQERRAQEEAERARREEERLAAIEAEKEEERRRQMQADAERARLEQERKQWEAEQQREREERQARREQEERERAERRRREEEAAADEAERLALQAAAAAALAERQRAEEEQRRQRQEERRRREEEYARRQAEERRRAEELAQRIAAAEAARRADEARRREEAARAREAERQREEEEMRRLAELKQRQEAAEKAKEESKGKSGDEMVNALIARHDRDNPFVDREFGGDAALFVNPARPGNPKWKTFNWDRPEQMKWLNKNSPHPKPVVFDDKIDPDDIKQGQIGNCYFMSALSVLTLRPEKLKRVFVCDANEAGVYAVRFHKDGAERVVIIDSLFPTGGKNHRPAFGRSRVGNEMWVSVVEKAYAKLYRNYESLEAGFVDQALVDLTGGIGSRLDMSKDEVKQMISNGTLFKILLQYHEDGFLLGAGSPAGSDNPEHASPSGIVQGHAYALIDVKQVDNVQLVQLRNPWGQFEWNGDYSDKSPLWTRCVCVVLFVQFQCFLTVNCLFSPFEIRVFLLKTTLPQAPAIQGQLRGCGRRKLLDELPGLHAPLRRRVRVQVLRQRLDQGRDSIGVERPHGRRLQQLSDCGQEPAVHPHHDDARHRGDRADPG